MNPERLTVELRPRSPWEAVDFGFALARANARTVWGSWLLFVGPVYALVWWLSFELPELAFLLIWWLKPLFGRLSLRVLSAAVFGERVDLRRLGRELPRLWTAGLGSALLLFRLDVWRALSMPAAMLEGVGLGRQARRRTELRAGVEGPASWLTMVCWLLKWGVFFGLVGSAFLLFPEQWGDMADALEGLLDGRTDTRAAQIALLVADFLALGLVEPLYVAGGFGLYLSRRTELEGWDVQIGFRRLAQRLAPLALLLLVVLPARADVLPPPRADGTRPPVVDTGRDPHRYAPPRTQADKQAVAAEVREDPQAVAAEVREDPQAVAAEVAEDPLFGGEETVTHWRLKGWEPRERSSSGCDRAPPEEAPELPGLTCGRAGQGALLGLLGMALVLILFAALRRRERGLRPHFRSGAVPATQAGEAEIPVGWLPEVPRLALEAWRAGEEARALGILYKGSVTSLREQGLPLGQGLTEGECVRVVRARGEARQHEPFVRLARAWQLAAYAHITPDTAAFEAMCHAWARDFGSPP